MELSVQSNIKQVMPLLERFTSKQAPFAIAMALTSTAKQVQQAMGLATNTAFDRPTSFTQKAFAYLPARKDKLQAIVFAKDKQARYLKFGVQGGGRRVKGFEKKFNSLTNADEQANASMLVPTKNIKRTAQGNVSMSTLKRITADLNTYNTAGRFFIGKPKGGGTNAGRGYGIYARTNNNNKIEALMVFANSPTYKKRFDMSAIGRKKVDEVFEANLRAAWATALATARR